MRLSVSPSTRTLLGALVILLALTAHGVIGQQRKRVQFELPQTVRLVTDVVYARYEARELRLDLYLPEPAAARVPVIVVIRGGGWRSGDKEGFRHIAGYLADAGFAAASIEYRVVPEAVFPAAVQDTKAAVRWLRANGSEYGIDPDRIGAIGGSAGAHLSALLGTSHKVHRLEGAGGHADVSSRVQAVVAMATPTDFTVGWPEESGSSAIQRVLGHLTAARP